MPLRSWRDAIDTELSDDLVITEAAVETNWRYRSRIRGSVRCATGRIYTSEAYEARRARVLARELP